MADGPVEQQREVHEILAREFTDRYLRRAGLSGVAYSVAFDPSNPLCDYTRTWWEAKPNRFSAPVGKAVLGKMHGLKPREVEDIVARPFATRADDCLAVLAETPLLIVNSHDVDLQAALSLLAANIGFAEARMEGSRQHVLEDMIRISHGVATRGLLPIMIGRPRMPLLPFLRLCQLIVNPHLSFPINRQMIESGISKEFRGAYNAKLRAESISSARAATSHPRGFRTLWSLSPGGTPDVPGEGEHEGKTITKLLEPATVNLIAEMGCAVLPVYTKLGKGRSETVVELGPITGRGDVTAEGLHSIMSDLAAFRRKHGETDVYYAGELGLSQ